MDGDRACTDALRVGGHAVSAQGCKQLRLELIAEQILAAVAAQFFDNIYYSNKTAGSESKPPFRLFIPHNIF